ncbi:post-GPI attachment to proteins factor 2-like isoform X2 [Ostrea edulis]|uniref:post-GPI attachment to proteins factor 2-like isoform X2 n=1 Tax=Ostrea edulis TaxID=37623 RepID=UPI0024AFC190|nr:post-GPI attachment to proteins factor 2-like isoform X2 [Ostrea edulis]
MDMTYQNVIFRLHFSALSKIVAGLPFFATLFCVIWSVLFNFKESTATHCRVPNYLPSISAAIGGYVPQRNVWRICIALHAFPRFLIACAYFHYHMQFLVEKWKRCYTILAGLCTLLHVVENFALVVLTYISSLENREVHEDMFVLFMVTSEVYMLLTCFVYRWGHSSNGRVMTQRSSCWRYTCIFDTTGTVSVEYTPGLQRVNILWCVRILRFTIRLK